MITRHYPSFVNSTTDEDKLANIIVSVSLLDEVISLRLLNRFLRITDTHQNEKDRVIFDKEILSKLTFREKVDVVSKILKDDGERKNLKSAMIRIGEIRNLVAHNTGMLGLPKDIGKMYEEFDMLMIELERFIELTYSQFQSQMNYAYEQQYQ